MNVGMLWLDNDPRTALTAKVARAADYYRQKYGLVPNLCLVHPSMLGEPGSEPMEGLVLPAPALRAQGSEVEGPAGKVAVRPSRAIQPGHLWIGTEEMD
jgi:hypothetical protein